MKKINYRVSLTPAYGRDYKNKRDVIKDFEAGKDFVLNHLGSQQYCSKPDFVPGTPVQLRYKNIRSVVVHNVGAKIPTR